MALEIKRLHLASLQGLHAPAYADPASCHHTDIVHS